MENPSQRYDPSSSSLHTRIHDRQDGDCRGRGGKEKGRKRQEEEEEEEGTQVTRRLLRKEKNLGQNGHGT